MDSRCRGNDSQLLTALGETGGERPSIGPEIRAYIFVSLKYPHGRVILGRHANRRRLREGASQTNAGMCAAKFSLIFLPASNSGE